MWKHDTFKELVESESDFTGMVAYSLYKNEKVTWIEEYKSEHKKYPTKDELEKYFYPTSTGKLTIKRYKE